MHQLTRKCLGIIIIGLSSLSLLAIAEEAVVDDVTLEQKRSEALATALKQVANGERVDENTTLSQEQLDAIQNTLQPVVEEAVSDPASLEGLQENTTP